MNNNFTELVFIIDKSGSMSGLESDTIGGFNSLIEKQKKEDGKCLVSTVFFNGESEVIHDRVDISKVNRLTEDDYCVGGCTALVDAIGCAVHHIANIHKYSRKEDIPDNTMFVITTDGIENASHIYSSEKVKSMIEEKKEKYGWDFIFIGANIDSVETAKHFGISEDRAVNYKHDKKGTEVLYRGVSKAVSSLRKECAVCNCWSDEIAEDFDNRK